MLPAEPADEIIKLFSAFLQADLMNRIIRADQGLIIPLLFKIGL